MLLALVAAGCGQSSTLGAASLAKRAAAVQSLAAEGALLAGDAADGRSTSVYRREHSSELAAAASEAAASLGLARTDPALEPRLRRLRKIAGRVESQLHRLGSASETGARVLERSLQAAANSSEQIGKGLE